MALTVNFCAPIAKGDFLIDLKETRTNRSTQHWSMELSQSDGVAASATAVFAKRRETWAHQPAAMPTIPSFETLTPMETEGRNAWLQRYDLRFAEGAVNFNARADGAGGDGFAHHLFPRRSAAGLAAQGTAPLIGVADTKVFRQGYFDQSAELWSADGRLLATSVQTVYFKE